jgi:hypothetical protein
MGRCTACDVKVDVDAPDSGLVATTTPVPPLIMSGSSSQGAPPAAVSVVRIPLWLVPVILGQLMQH